MERVSERAFTRGKMSELGDISFRIPSGFFTFYFIFNFFFPVPFYFAQQIKVYSNPNSVHTQIDLRNVSQKYIKAMEKCEPHPTNFNLYSFFYYYFGEKQKVDDTVNFPLIYVWRYNTHTQSGVVVVVPHHKMEFH